MTDPTSAPVPVVASSEPLDDTAATTPAAAGSLTTPTAATSTGYQVDYAALRDAHGDPDTWASHLADMLVHTTGTFIAPETFTPWFAAFADETKRAEARQIAFEIANATISDAITGDAGALLLDLRNDLSRTVRKRAGI